MFEAAAHVGGHTHTHERRGRGPAGLRRHRLHRLQRPHLSALHRAARAARRRHAGERDELLGARRGTGLEYNGTSLNALFAQRRNLLRPAFLGMVRDILRFNREAPRLLDGQGPELTLGDLLAAGRYGRAFREHYIVPMGAAIWSTDPARMLDFPARFFVRFLHNHGMLTVNDRPVWRTIRAARRATSSGSSRRSATAFACDAGRVRATTARRRAGEAARARGAAIRRRLPRLPRDQALRAARRPGRRASAKSSARFRYQRNEAVLHTDTRLLPRRRLAWAAWNYHRLAIAAAPVALTYHMNILQRLELPVAAAGDAEPHRRDRPRPRPEAHDLRHPVFTLGVGRGAGAAARDQRRAANLLLRRLVAQRLPRGRRRERRAAVGHFEEDHAQRALHRSA